MKEYLPYITTIIAILGFVFSVYKYIDLKNREERRLTYENFDKTLSSLSGTILSNGDIKIEISFLIGNIYKLTEYPQYKNISLPVLNYMKAKPIKTDNESKLLVDKALDNVKEILENLK